MSAQNAAMNGAKKMIKTMQLEIYYSGGGYLTKDILYHGDMEGIAKEIERDENSLLEYMRTKDEHGEKAFCFQGFMFLKNGIIAAQFTEPTI